MMFWTLLRVISSLSSEGVRWKYNPYFEMGVEKISHTPHPSNREQWQQ